MSIKGETGKLGLMKLECNVKCVLDMLTWTKVAGFRGAVDRVGPWYLNVVHMHHFLARYKVKVCSHLRTFKKIFMN